MRKGTLWNLKRIYKNGMRGVDPGRWKKDGEKGILKRETER